MPCRFMARCVNLVRRSDTSEVGREADIACPLPDALNLGGGQAAVLNKLARHRANTWA
jgi:hypothetical protein